MRSKKNKARKKKIVIIMIVVLLLTIIGVVSGIFIAKNMLNKEEVIEEIEEKEELPEEEDNVLIATLEQEEVKEVQTFIGNDRPIAVMLDNNKNAWPQVGINNAYMVYEIIVEGSETRLMALFKGEDVETIGAVRSSRPYFLDYALEHDAIYAHFGGSPQALSDISTLSVNNINGIYEDGTTYLRTSSRYAPHNVMTSIENLYQSASNKNYDLESDVESVLNYTVEDVMLEEGDEATNITIPHSSLQTVNYKYNEETMKYERYAREAVQLDEETSEGIETKNIIIQFTDNYTLDSSGRQGLYNTGTFDGYYITNGKAIKIKCSKTSRTAQSVYTDLDGNEIDVNDGNTFVHICSKSTNVTLNN